MTCRNPRRISSRSAFYRSQSRIRAPLFSSPSNPLGTFTQSSCYTGRHVVSRFLVKGGRWMRTLVSEKVGNQPPLAGTQGRDILQCRTPLAKVTPCATGNGVETQASRCMPLRRFIAWHRESCLVVQSICGRAKVHRAKHVINRCRLPGAGARMSSLLCCCVKSLFSGWCFR